LQSDLVSRSLQRQKGITNIEKVAKKLTKKDATNEQKKMLQINKKDAKSA